MAPATENGNIARPESIIKTELSQYAKRRGTEGPYADNLDVDVLVVGGGFGGSYMLYEMRKAGYKTVLYEAGTSFGGTWRWNIYPGARVDSPSFIYELSIPEVYKDWNWSTNYPDWTEIQAYFDHMDKVLNLSKDCAFETVVHGAEFDINEGKWKVHTVDGRTAKAKHLVVCAGFAAKRYIPAFKSMDKFKGIIHHSSFWPPEGVDAKGKRCAVIGTGASGVQIIQEWGPQVGSLKVFQRTPNLAIPMGKKPLTKEEQERVKPAYEELLAYREKCFGGFTYDLYEKTTWEVTPEDREAWYENLWEKAGFQLWLGNFKDYLFDMKSNEEVYKFWRKKQAPRVKDPRKRELLCPEEQPHPWGCKRPSLEQDYYEQFNRDSVDIVDISKKSGNNIEEFTETGIKTTDGKHYEFDIIAVATGFDVSTGGMTNMGLKNLDGKDLKDEWSTGVKTYLGTMVPRCPNLYHLYGPQAPTLLANGPTAVEVQGRWIRDAILMQDAQGIKYIEPTREAGDEWKKRIIELNDLTLFPFADSTYMGSSIPGKVREPMCYSGGIPAFKEEIRAVFPTWKGFNTVKV